MSLFKKILIPAMSGLFLLSGLCIFFTLEAFETQREQELASLRATMMVEKKEKMRNLVEMAYHILSFAQKNPDLDMDQRKFNALSLIRKLRYNQSDYLWINDMQPTMIMHPFKPDLDGKSLADFKDPTGKNLFVSMVEVCKRENEGTVDYCWPKPGHDQPVPKLSYVKRFEPWDWIVGTGIYIDDIDAAVAEKALTITQTMQRQRNRLLLIAALILGLTATALTLITRSLVRPITQAVNFAGIWLTVI